MMLHNSIEKYLELKPCHYRILKEINISRRLSHTKSYGYDVEIILSKYSNDSYDSLRMLCINSSDIKIGYIEGMPGLLVNIEDISRHQIEGCKYHITEQEEGAFSLKCEEFFVDLIK